MAEIATKPAARDRNRSHRASRLLRRPEGRRSSHWTLGCGLALSLLALEAVAEFLTPDEARIEFNWFRTLSLPLLSGYLYGALNEGVRAAQGALLALAPSLRRPEAAADLVARVAAPPRAVLRIAGGCGAAIPLLLGLILLTDRAAGVLAGNPSDLFYAAAALLFWVLAGLTAAFTLENSRLFGRIARDLVDVDLFHLERLRPFGSLGLRLSLLALGALALIGLLMATPEAGRAWLLRARLPAGVPLVVPGFLASAAVALAALLLPMWAIRRRIQQEKRFAIARIAEALGPHWEETAMDRLEEGEHYDRLPALLSLRAQVSELSEWPLDDSMRRRFGLYTLIPVLTWTLKAALESAVGGLLG